MKALNAMHDPESVKRSPLLSTIDLVLQELNERQKAGHLNKRMDRLEKNRIAMSFVDLHDRVMHNPKMAMDDQRI